MFRLCVVLFPTFVSCFFFIFLLCLEFLYFHFLKTFVFTWNFFIFTFFFWGGKNEQDRHSITESSRTRVSNPQEIPIFYPAQPQIFTDFRNLIIKDTNIHFHDPTVWGIYGLHDRGCTRTNRFVLSRLFSRPTHRARGPTGPGNI